MVTGLLAAHVAFLLHGVSWTVTLLQAVLQAHRVSADLQTGPETIIKKKTLKEIDRKI